MHSHFFLLQKVFPKGLKITFNSLDSAWNSGNYTNGSMWALNYFLQSHSSVIFLNLQCKIIICYSIYAVCAVHSPCFSLETITQSLHCISLSYFILKTTSLLQCTVWYHTCTQRSTPCLASLDKYWSELFTLWMYHLFRSGSSFWRKHHSNLYNCK